MARRKKKLGIRLEVKGGKAEGVSPDYWGEIHIMQGDVEAGKVGFTISNEKIYVDDFNVEAEFQKTGYGSIMMDVIKGLARFLRKPVHLYSSSDSPPFYRKMGFVSILDPEMRKRICIIKGSNPKENDFIWIPECFDGCKKKFRMEV